MQERYVLICTNLHRIASAKTDMIKWSMDAKKESDNPFVFSLFFPAFPYISLPLSRALKYGKHSLLLQAETCDEAQNKKRNYKQNKNKMGYFIITDPNWANGTVFQSV